MYGTNVNINYWFIWPSGTVEYLHAQKETLEISLWGMLVALLCLCVWLMAVCFFCCHLLLVQAKLIEAYIFWKKKKWFKLIYQARLRALCCLCQTKILCVCILFQFDVFFYITVETSTLALLPTHSPIQWVLGFRAILWGQSGQSLILTSHFHLMPSLRISGATPLSPSMTS